MFQRRRQRRPAAQRARGLRWTDRGGNSTPPPALVNYSSRAARVQGHSRATGGPRSGAVRDSWSLPRREGGVLDPSCRPLQGHEPGWSSPGRVSSRWGAGAGTQPRCGGGGVSLPASEHLERTLVQAGPKELTGPQGSLRRRLWCKRGLPGCLRGVSWAEDRKGVQACLFPGWHGRGLETVIWCLLSQSKSRQNFPGQSRGGGKRGGWEHGRFIKTSYRDFPGWSSGSRTCLPVQSTPVRFLVWEDSTCLGATKPPVGHKCWSPRTLEGALCNQRNHPREKLVQATRVSPTRHN